MPEDEDVRRTHAGWVPAALTDIGLATILTDALGQILEMSPVAEALTGWTPGEALGRPLAEVFRTQHESTREPVTDPLGAVLATGVAVSLADHTVLTTRDGRERRIDHGAAPGRDAAGAIAGAVLIFCDVSERQRAARAVEVARAFAEAIVETVHEPLLVLDANCCVILANRSYSRTFRVASEEIEGRSFLDLGGGEWDLPRLRELLDGVAARDNHFSNFEVNATFDGIGHRSMVLNARRLTARGGRDGMVLLAIEDATDRLRAAETLGLSEVRYRRLFETAQDGILLVDPKSRRVFDANPFLTDLLGFTHGELVGRELWEIGVFHDIASNKAAFETLLDRGYIRYEGLPLLTKDGRHIEVEFVSNVYRVGESRVIQCNIRDVTDRKLAEDAVRVAHAQLEHRVKERTAELAQANVLLTEEIARRERAESDRRELQQLLTTAQEDERRRIARELHDQMGQHLTALGLGLKVVKDDCPDPSPARDRLQGLQALTDLIGREVHQIALELRPTALDDIGLQAALANYAEGWSERSGVEVDFHGAGLEGVRLPAPVETALYRVVQEALTNVLKHATARHVSVVLQRAPGQVSAVVEDDGRGFDTDSPEALSAAEGRLGVLGMRERMALVGGTLAIESEVGQGTTVIARVPLSGEVGDG